MRLHFPLTFYRHLTEHYLKTTNIYSLLKVHQREKVLRFEIMLFQINRKKEFNKKIPFNFLSTV